MKRVYKVKNQLKRSPGIYKISCTETNKVYIGETLDLSNRLQKHFSLLRKNKHSNPILQNIFNKYGEETFEVEVLEYVDFTDDFKLKTLEREWQNKFEHCISLDSNEIYHIERSEEWKQKQRKILNEQREKALENCKIPCYVYDITENKLISYTSLTDAEELVERKHIDLNLSGILTPFKNRYVVFKQKGYTDDLLNDIIKINSNIAYTSVRNLCTLYNLLDDTYKNFASKTQLSLEFGKRNTKIYDKLFENNLISFDFKSVIKPKTKDELFNMNINLCPKFTKSFVNVGLFYKALSNFKSAQKLAEDINISYSTLRGIIKFRTIPKWIQLFEKLVNLLPD